ncbi:reverse transcriptase domain-containing protein [Tanacetum coccineum]|uniref:Reverse transcriptase domain-containing protein n=1 Tax=Tanacetum coccineum TaxID=301880 RepID=A0ABQ4ZQF2_9ASTR
MRTRSQSRNQNHPQQQAPPVVVEPFNFEEPFDMAANGAGGAGPPPVGGGGLPVPDLRTMEELCQPSLDGRGGPIAPIAIQATTFGLKNDMIHTLNGVSDDALRLHLFPYSLQDRAAEWFDRLPRNSINSFDQMAKIFLGKYFPPSMVTKLRNDITNFRQRPDESLFEAGKRPEECYDLIENITSHHNDWDTFAQRNESSSSITSYNPEIASLKLQMEEMNRNFTRMLQTNQQVNTVTPSCKTCGGPHSYNDCPATVGQNQNVYTVGTYNQGGNSYQPQESTCPSFWEGPFLGNRAHALIDVHGEEMILHDVYNVSYEEIREDLFATNHPSGNPTSSLTSHTDLTSPEVVNQSSGNPTPILEPETKSSSPSPTFISLKESELIWEEFEAYLASDSFPPGNSNPSSLLPPFHNSLSGSTTSSSPSLHISETSNYFLEEFADELAHITFSPGNDVFL